MSGLDNVSSGINEIFEDLLLPTDNSTANITQEQIGQIAQAHKENGVDGVTETLVELGLTNSDEEETARKIIERMREAQEEEIRRTADEAPTSKTGETYTEPDTPGFF